MLSLAERREQTAESLKDFRDALALGDISAVQDHIDDVLDAFNINLDRQGTAYPKLGIEVLRAYVRALQAIQQRDAGEPVPTPLLPNQSNQSVSGTLSEAFDGWKKGRDRPAGTVQEYGRAIDMLTQLHGTLPIPEIKRSHVRTFRDALQLVPKSRKGCLLKASLVELSEYGRKHPTAVKVSAGTVNKQLGAVQAIAGWGYHNGFVPEDTTWADPFSEMRLEEDRSEREPFDARDLQTIFDAPLFTEHKLPMGAKGHAGTWLPLLALFAGARLAEYAGLRASDVREDAEAVVPLMWLRETPRLDDGSKRKHPSASCPCIPSSLSSVF